MTNTNEKTEVEVLKKEITNEKQETVTLNEEKTSENVVVFKKPYIFEGTEYTSIDLSAVEDLTGEDLLEADKIYNSSGQYSPMPEMTLGYLSIIAARATKKPVEFFKKLPAKEALRVKNKVLSFLNN